MSQIAIILNASAASEDTLLAFQLKSNNTIKDVYPF